MAKIEFTTNGFTEEAKYSFHLRTFFKQYESMFGEAEIIYVEIDELPITMIGKPSKSPIKFSEDGKIINIYCSTHKYYDTKGRITEQPSPESFFQTLSFLMNKASQEYSKKFK